MASTLTADDDSAIEIDPEVLHDDDGFVDDPDSYSTSCTPSVTMYPIENGRRYHAFKSGAYPLPNDEEELERLNVVHNMVKTALGDKLYLAPISDFGRVLDIGTGTGCWAIEMGDLFPQAEFLGNDLSPVQPTWVPPNVRFEVDDVESGWVYGAPQDFIFCRNLNFAVSDFPRLAKQAFDNVRPGGWVEFQDFDVALYSEDDSYHPSSDLAKYMQLLMDSARKAGKEPRTGPKLEQWVRDAGFQNITHQKFKLPLGLWPKDKRQKEVGLYNLMQALDGLEAYSMRLFTTMLDWKPEEVQVLCAKVRADLKNKSAHRIMDFHVVYGQRPEGEIPEEEASEVEVPEVEVPEEEMWEMEMPDEELAS